MPVFAWSLAREKRKLQSLMVVFLDGAAREWKPGQGAEPGRG